MKRGGKSLIIVLCTAIGAQSFFAQEPPRNLTPDEIQRIMEQERIRRAQELQTNPSIGISIQMAQEIHTALTSINFKAEELRLVIRVELERAQRAESLALAAGHYETCLMHGFAFRRFSEGQLAGKLDDVNHPKRVAALTQLDDLLNKVYTGYVKNRVSLAEAHQQRHDFDKAKRIIGFALQILPDNLDLQAFARANEREEAAWIRQAPGAAVVMRERELKDRDQQIRTLLRDGRYLYELRDFDEAELKFERVLDFDPVNDVADNYIRLINKIRGDHAVLKRDRNFRRRVQEVNDAWDPPTHQKRLPIPNPDWQRQTMKGHGGSAVGGAGANNNVFQKLQSIRIPRMEPLDGFTLIEAVNLVALAAKENDIATSIESQKGVNMIISTRLPGKQVNVSVFGGNNFGPAFAPRVNPNNGLPEINRLANGTNSEGNSMSEGFGSGRRQNAGQSGAVGAGKAAAAPPADPRHFDPNNVTVRGLTAPLNNLTLGQLIHAITEACDQPIDYEVKNGLLVFKYRSNDLNYQTRTFTIKPNMFWQHLASHGDAPTTGGNPLYGGLPLFDKQTSVSETGSLQGSASGGAPGGGAVIDNTQLGAQIKAYFEGLGISAPQVFINPSNGQLLVRAPLADLDLIDQAIEILNSSPEQLYIEAKFAEIEFNDGESLGFDWYLGNSTMMGNRVIHGAGPQPTFIGQQSANNPSGFFPYPGTLTGNTFTPSPFSIPPDPNEGKLTAGFKGYGNPLWSFTGIMTDPQFRMVINAISKQEGAELLSAPRLLAISGQVASIQLQDQRSIVTGMTPTFTPGQGLGAQGGGTVTPQTMSTNLGPSLIVLPYVNSDGYTIEMSLVPSIAEFLGYEESAFQASVFASGGQTVTSAVPIPRFRERTMNVTCVVWDQTVLAVGGLISETVQTTRDKVPYFGDLPFVGRLFRGKGRDSKKKNMVIYVKPTIIDPAGNQKNNPDQLPFARTQAPPSVSFVPPQDPAAFGGRGAGPINKIQGGRILAQPRR